MPILDVVSRTIKCEGPECPNTITFDPANAEQVANLPLWLRTTRTVQLGNRQQFLYCSDVCEVKGVTTGNHNVPEPKKIQPANESQINQAAAEAKAVAQVDEALKKGTIELTDQA